jgi:predicted LPLAT superfamily acyltransferase
LTSWKGKTRGGLAGYKIFVNILKYLGIPFAYFLLIFVALYFFLATPSSFRNSYNFYHRRLKFRALQSVLAIYKNYYAFGQVILDRIAVMGGMGPKFTYDFEGEDHLRKMIADQSGGLLISAHIGNFEMAGHMLQRLKVRINVILLDAEHRQIKDYLSSHLLKSFHIIPITQDNRHLYEIKRAFENHEIVCVHGDRFLPGSKTISLEFLGEKASFPTGPFYLGMKYNVPVSFVFAMKESKRHYHFYATSPRTYRQQLTPVKRNEMTRQMMTEYIDNFEYMIKKYSYQWFNYYNFWELSNLQGFQQKLTE